MNQGWPLGVGRPSRPRRVIGADVVYRDESGRYVVGFDYVDQDRSHWLTYEEAKAEAARLWNVGLALQLVDLVARPARGDEGA